MTKATAKKTTTPAPAPVAAVPEKKPAAKGKKAEKVQPVVEEVKAVVETTDTTSTESTEKLGDVNFICCPSFSKCDEPVVTTPTSLPSVSISMISVFG